MNAYLASINSTPLNQKVKLYNIILRPEISLVDVVKNVPTIFDLMRVFRSESIELAEIDIKYRRLSSREKDLVDKMNRLEEVRLIDNFNFKALTSLSAEAREKLTKHKPSHHWSGESDQRHYTE